MERRLYRRLGSYFQPPNGGDEWTRPPLLVKGKHGHGHSSYQHHFTYPNS